MVYNNLNISLKKDDYISSNQLNVKNQCMIYKKAQPCREEKTTIELIITTKHQTKIFLLSNNLKYLTKKINEVKKLNKYILLIGLKSFKTFLNKIQML